MAAEAARWMWSDGVEGEISDTETRMTLKEHERLWQRYFKEWRSECVRMRGCYGCIYLASCGLNLCCAHLLDTGERRPGAFSKSPCVGKICFPDWKPTPEYEKFLLETEKELSVKKSFAPKKGGRRGKACGWDTEYGYQLYKRGFSVNEIAAIVGVKRNAIASYANAHNWRNDRHTINYPKKRGRDLTDEIEAFRRHIAEKEAEAAQKSG